MGVQGLSCNLHPVVGIPVRVGLSPTRSKPIQKSFFMQNFRSESGFGHRFDLFKRFSFFIWKYL